MDLIEPRFAMLLMGMVYIRILFSLNNEEVQRTRSWWGTFFDAHMLPGLDHIPRHRSIPLSYYALRGQKKSGRGASQVAPCPL